MALIAACVGIYFFVQPTGQATFTTADPAQQQIDDLTFTLDHAAIPCELITAEPLSIDEIERTFNGGDASACRRDDGGSPEAFPDLEGDVKQSIARVKASPFVPNKDSVRGFVYEVETGRLREVS